MEFLIGVSFLNFLFIKMRSGKKVENCILIQKSPKEREMAQITMKAGK